MNKNKGFGVISALVIIFLVLVMGALAFWLSKKSNINDIPIVNTNMPSSYNNNLQNKNIYECSTEWLTYEGVYKVKYPGDCWVVFEIKGGSIGTANSDVGVLLRSAISSNSNDSISIGGWQYDCSDVNVSGVNNSELRSSVTKAFCLKPENGDKWSGQYITTSNQGKIFGIPVVTSSTDPDLLEMFDRIIEENIK